MDGLVSCFQLCVSAHIASKVSQQELVQMDGASVGVFMQRCMHFRRRVCCLCQVAVSAAPSVRYSDYLHTYSMYVCISILLRH